MAKKVQMKKRPLVVMQRAKPKARPQRPSAGLDAAGAAHAQLLNDPCGAALTKPVYIGTGSGYLTRFTQDVTFTQDSGLLCFTPAGTGLLGNSGIIQAAGASSSAALVTNSAVTGPGVNFLAGVADQARPVAACIQVIYTGTELNRAGIINRAQFTGADCAFLDSTTGLTFDSVASSFPVETRTPAERLEVKWAPGMRDSDFTGLNVGTRVGDRGSIGVLWRGLGATSSIKLRITVVYEWRPTAIEGVVAPVATGDSSHNTIGAVVNALFRSNPSWGFSDSMMKLGSRAFGVLAPMAADRFVPGSGALLRSLY